MFQLGITYAHIHMRIHMRIHMHILNTQLSNAVNACNMLRNLQGLGHKDGGKDVLPAYPIEPMHGEPVNRLAPGTVAGPTAPEHVVSARIPIRLQSQET